MVARKKKPAAERTRSLFAPLERADVLRVAATAGVDPRTVQGLLDGRRVQPATRAAVAAALSTLGFSRAAAAVDAGHV